ncbi:hypothetical protein Taro_053926 [Colocasia esculenta]|uniref:Uncharacterized protein n=1 Tax=Colocasia esculenta TaxID=4460 RepID=A0A843XNI9_COLES|nr:hypothetical protein [Colocasia esculenta]
MRLVSLSDHEEATVCSVGFCWRWSGLLTSVSDVVIGNSPVGLLFRLDTSRVAGVAIVFHRFSLLTPVRVVGEEECCARVPGIVELVWSEEEVFNPIVWVALGWSVLWVYLSASVATAVHFVTPEEASAWVAVTVPLLVMMGRLALRTFWWGTRQVTSMRLVIEGDTFVAMSWQWFQEDLSRVRACLVLAGLVAEVVSVSRDPHSREAVEGVLWATIVLKLVADVSVVRGGSACGPSTLWRSEVAVLVVRRPSHMVALWSPRVCVMTLAGGLGIALFFPTALADRGSSSRELGVGRVAEVAVVSCAVSSSDNECCELLYLNEMGVVLFKFSGDRWIEKDLVVLKGEVERNPEDPNDDQRTQVKRMEKDPENLGDDRAA